jgi:lysophospholipase L1-like esterase
MEMGFDRGGVGMRWISLGSGAILVGATLCTFGCAKDDPFADDGGDDEGSGSTQASGADDEAEAGPGPATAPEGDATADDAPSDDTGPSEESGAEAPADGDSGEGEETGTSECPPTPTRLVVLGDSIFACSNVGGKANEQCSAKALHTYLSEALGPMAYENLAVNGAVTRDIPQSQLDTIDVGMNGHVLVLIFIGGNDLQPFIYQSDDQTLSNYEQMRPELDADWAAIFEFLQDPANFPDGTTILMNTQYNPFDDCTAAPEYLSQVKIDLLHEYNDDLVAKAESQPNAAIADQHGPYLGHGHHFDDAMCPHYMAGAENWMADLIHPDAGGHANLATVLSAKADEVYAACK